MSDKSAWNVCKDGIDPLADDLKSLAIRWNYLKNPASVSDVDDLYSKHRLAAIVDWLRFHQSVEYAEHFKTTLLGVRARFAALNFKACQIFNGDEGREETTWVRHAIHQVMDRHYAELRRRFPNHENHPERDELPDDLLAFEVEVLDEYTLIEQQFHAIVGYLRRASAMIADKAKVVAVPDSEEIPPELLSKHYTPTELARLYDRSWDTIKRRMAAGTIRYVKHSTKDYQIHVDDLPPG